MKTTVVFVFVVCCALSALSLAEDENKAKPPQTVSPAKEFPTTPKPTTTTPKPTTTTPKPTTTTTKPTTTTTKPTTTTPKPTTKANATTTAPNATTTAPNATTTAPNATTTTPNPPTPPPTPQPTPPTTSRVGNYNLTVKNEVCLRSQMALQIRVARPQLNGTFIVQPNITTASGSCGDTKANLTLSFKEGFITFLFNKSADNTTGQVNALSFNFTYAFIKGKEENFLAKNNTVRLFAAKIGHCYSCKQTESFYMGNGLYLEVSQDQIQAFNLTKSKDFGIPDHCTADQSDYRVAIGVGVTLLVLIIIVVLAYLLTRKRRTDGYQAL